MDREMRQTVEGRLVLGAGLGTKVCAACRALAWWVQHRSGAFWMSIAKVSAVKNLCAHLDLGSRFLTSFRDWNKLPTVMMACWLRSETLCFIHGQLQEGLKHDIMHAPAVSRAQSCKELCLAAQGFIQGWGGHPENFPPNLFPLLPQKSTSGSWCHRLL